MSIEEDIAQRIDKELHGDCGYGVGEHLAAVLMPLVRRAQAEAWDEGFTRGFYKGQIMSGDFDASEADVTNPYAAQEVK
jgi:hypothetical protein